MNMGSARRRLFATTMIGSLALTAALAAQPAAAQTASAAAKPANDLEEVVVTGSRIHQAATDTPAPVETVTQQDLTDRGFVTAGQALNDLTSMVPAQALSTGPGVASGNGQTFPNLFNLGPGRTLTLVDGRRYVSSATPVTSTSSGSGSGVDTNLIPVGLIDRVDVVQAGGAAVYGSDAIAGVVNYVLKQNFQGLEMDAQTSITSRNDYPQNSIRVTGGRNFMDGRGNVALDVEWSKSDPLSTNDRPTSALSRSTSGTTEILNSRFYEFNTNGVIFTIPAPVPACGGQNCFLRVGGVPQQFSADGASLVAFNPGVNPINGSGLLIPPFATGGDGFPLKDLSGLLTGVERLSANLLTHYDVTDHMKLSGSLLFGSTRADDPQGSQGFSQTILNPAASGAGPIAFTKANPFLTASELAALTAAQPSFGAGAPLFLSKDFVDLLPSQDFITTTDSYRFLLALDGDFNRFGRDFYYSLSYSYGQVDSKQQGWSINNAKFKNAISATTNAQGQIVCSINAVTVVDPSCAPINPFGSNTASAGAGSYVSTPVGYSYQNQQDDFLATLGGDIFDVPAGKLKFSVAYEHRVESQAFNPAAAIQLGLTGTGTLTSPTSGRYYTNEYSGELLLPVLGEGFNLPGFKTVELSAQYRFVDNSIAGTEDVWGLGLRWEVVPGFSLRASRSRNFRAPTLYQLFAPSTTALAGGVQDPCDSRFINAGTNPAVRAQNCLALFSANPLYGTGSAGTAPVGSSAAARLAGFQDTAVNFSTAQVTSGGNQTLQNEVSDTTTYGFVFQPAWVPGRLTVVADYISVDLQNGLTSFTPTNFSQACFDAPGANGATCGFFTRDGVGNIATAVSTTFNAASLKYKGETIDATYSFPLEWIVSPDKEGNVELALEATHNETLKQTVQGVVTELVNTVGTFGLPEPRWQVRGDVRYIRGPLRVTYEAFYLPSALAVAGATAANNAHPFIESNLRQDISASYDFGRYQVRGGVHNFTDEMPSYPTLSYGDIIGRQFFLGVRARF
ncbi:TonB-dependent receptor domain-containing protein [Phenylobacterium sp.]|jgi:outer membrane receptor protein involved in Fe transport|uniref:TonB-dependent receptor domain-containing protein n=1 Tax=Phenylobacterium sp. TaxID=1871053 RepID=UPI002E3022E8|nr:TonB-dependent receptor [Phenylobacterium sp.]HEX3366327.1 TonB-dependent receptor [Phenylobacterium sp.]